jgi:aromatic ring-opening dioxygenase LigB subunit
MAITKTFILPHSPLLIPEIGRENLAFLDKTSAAYRLLGERLKAAGCDTLLIISPHGNSQETGFNINVAPEMFVQLQDFGFIPARQAFVGDSLLADQIKTSLKGNFALDLISEDILDYGSAIPAQLLRPLAGNFKLLVLMPAANLSTEEQFRFGEALGVVLEQNAKKIAVLASSDLSHRLKKKSPGGYSPKGTKFDSRVLEALRNPQTAKEDLLKINDSLIKEAGECGLKPICLLLGIISGKEMSSEVLAYQTDFGIGYLSLDLKEKEEKGTSH